MNLWIKGDAANGVDASFHLKQQKLTAGHLAEQNDNPTFLLDDHGLIQEFSQTVEKQFGYGRSDLVWQHISCLFPQLSDIELVLEDRLNPRLSYICHCDHIFEALNCQGDIIICNLSFIRIKNDGNRFLRLIVRPASSVEA